MFITPNNTNALDQTNNTLVVMLRYVCPEGGTRGKVHINQIVQPFGSMTALNITVINDVSLLWH